MSRKGTIKQEFFPGFEGLNQKRFGGTLLRGNAREARPVSTQRALHLVLRSSHATGERSFLRSTRAKRIEMLAHRLGREKGVKVYRFANGGNHLHLLLLPRSRKAYNAYIRALSGLIARLTLRAERGQPRGLKFWDAKPFSRIVEWGKEFKGVCEYILQNTLEALGFIPYQPRRKRRKAPG